MAVSTGSSLYSLSVLEPSDIFRLLVMTVNTWWGCFLEKKNTSIGGHVYMDTSLMDPDQEHENQNCTNPQIGLALLKRTLTAQLTIAEALNVTVDPIIADMASHLPPFAVWECDASGSKNLQSGATCKPGSKLWTQCGTGSMTRFGDDTIHASDGYSLYPLFPAEVVNVFTSSEAELEIARNSVAYYTGIGDPYSNETVKSCLSNMVHTFSMMERAGWPANITLPYLKQFLELQRADFVPSLNSIGSGMTERLGISLAVVDMLVQAPTSTYIVLFPAWDLAEDAAFADLLVKGAVRVSASWSAKRQTVFGVSVVVSSEHRGLVVIRKQLGMGDNWKVVRCADGMRPAVHSTSELFSFAAPAGVRCTIGTPTLD